MKGTILITVVSEHKRLSCSKYLHWNSKKALDPYMVLACVYDAERKLALLEAKGPRKKAPKAKGK